MAAAVSFKRTARSSGSSSSNVNVPLAAGYGDVGLDEGATNLWNLVNAVENLNLPRVAKLFTDPHARDLTDRHLSAVRRICETCSFGLFVGDLVHINPILKFSLQEALVGKTEYMEPLERLIRLISLPFLRRTSSEEHRNYEEMCETFRIIAEIMCHDQIPTVQLACAETILNYIKAGRAGDSSGKELLNLRVVEAIGIIPSLVEVMRGLENPEIQLTILRILCELSFLREMVFLITREGALELVVNVFAVHFRDERVYVALELLWNCLDQDPHATDVIGSWHSINLMKELFVNIATDGFKQKDKEIRNEILVLATLVASNVGNHPVFVDTGFLHVLVLFGTAFELNLEHEIVKPFCMTTSQEDFELKKLCWNLIGLVSEHPANLAVTIEGNLIPVFLLFVDETGKDHPAVSRWGQTQLKELQLQALSSLVSLSLLAPGEFQRHEGLKILLGFFSKATDAKFRRTALRVLLNLSSLSDLREELGLLGVLSQMLQIVGSRDSIRFRVDALNVISYLCRDNEQNQNQFGSEGGVGILKDCLRLNPFQSENDQLLMAAVDCVWNAVVPHAQNLNRFLVTDGMRAFLNLLEIAPYVMRSQMLSCLADCLENPAAVPAFREWKSEKSQRRMPQVLITFWGVEEDKAGQAEQDEVVQNESRPLEGTAKKQSTSSDVHFHITQMRSLHPSLGEENLHKPSVSEAVVDQVFGQDVKAKLYSIFVAAGFDRYDYLETKHAVKLKLIEKYMQFKEGEVWSDIVQELDVEGTRPTTPDKEFLEQKIAENAEAFESLKANQNSLFTDRLENDLEEEANFFNTLSTIHQQEAEELKYAAFSTRPAASRIQSSTPSQKRKDEDGQASPVSGGAASPLNRTGGSGSGAGQLGLDRSRGSVSENSPATPVSVTPTPARATPSNVPNLSIMAMQGSPAPQDDKPADSKYVDDYLQDNTLDEYIGTELVKAVGG